MAYDVGGFGGDGGFDPLGPMYDPEDLKRKAILGQMPQDSGAVLKSAPAGPSDAPLPSGAGLVSPLPPSYPGGAPPPLPPSGGVTGGATSGGTGTIPPPSASAASPQASAAPFQYEHARDSWMSGQYGSGEAGARAWAQANGVPYNGGDTITLPNGGGQIDIIGNFAGGAGNGQRMTNNWTPAGGNGPNPGGSAPAKAPVPDAPPPSPIAPPPPMRPFEPTAPPPQARDPLQGQLREQLLAQMKGAEQPVDENALGIRQPYQAASLAAQRQQDIERNTLAEQMYASGNGAAGSGSELSQRLQQSAERNAVGLAGVKAGLVGNEINAKRQQLSQALQMANSIGARQEAMQLQKELADLDNKYRYAALGQNASQFGQSLAQQNSQFGQQLGQNQGQWNDRYGLDRQRMIDEQNRYAMLYGMNG